MSDKKAVNSFYSYVTSCGGSSTNVELFSAVTCSLPEEWHTVVHYPWDWLHVTSKNYETTSLRGRINEVFESYNTEHKLCSQVGSIPASCLWDLGFKSQTRDHLSWLKFHNIFVYLFAYGLLYNAVSSSDIVGECLVSNKLEKMQKEAVVT